MRHLKNIVTLDAVYLGENSLLNFENIFVRVLNAQPPVQINMFLTI